MIFNTRNYSKQLQLLTIIFLAIILTSILIGSLYGFRNWQLINQKIDNTSNIIQLSNSITNYNEFLIHLNSHKPNNDKYYSYLKKHKYIYTQSMVLIHKLLIEFETFNNLSQNQEQVIIQSLYDIQTKISTISFRIDNYLYQSKENSSFINHLDNYFNTEQELLQKELLLLSRLNQNDIKLHIKKTILNLIVFLIIISIFGFLLFTKFKQHLLANLTLIRSNYNIPQNSNEIQFLNKRYIEQSKELTTLKDIEFKHNIIVKEKNKQITQITEQLINTQENERQNISQFIHNDLGQHLTALNLETSSLEDKVPNLNDLNQIKYLIDTSLKKIKSISKYIHPPQLNNQSLTTIFKSHSKEILPDDMALKLTIENENNLSDNQKLAIFRSFQECLTNIIRHANATEIIVSLKKHNKSMVFTIEDNGDGMKKNHNSTGLIAIKHRVSMLNGTFDIKNKQIGDGALVRISLPL